MFISDSPQDIITEEIVPAFGLKAPKLGPVPIFFHDLPSRDLLVERVQFNLVDCRDNLIELDEIDEPVRIEIAYPDGSNLTFLVCFYHCPVGSVVIVEGLMDKQQVQVIQLKPCQ